MAKSTPASNPRGYTDNTLKRLFALSGNQCAYKMDNIDCKEKIVMDGRTDLKTQICHIEDAYPGGRYNINMTDKQRADFPNLMLLCPNHHIETNDVTKYTVDVLKKMKREHEAKMLLSFPYALVKNPTALAIVVNQIAISNILSAKEENGNSFDIQQKIDYNNVQRYKPILEEYKIYQGKLNTIYEEIEKDGSSKKDLLLQNIKSLYLREKGKYSSFDEVKQNADNIIEVVENEMWSIIDSSNNLNQLIPLEAVEISILIILVDAFMRCKILEEPPKV